MKKWMAWMVAVLTLAGLLAGCAGQDAGDSMEPPAHTEGKVNVVATLFPQYDFARQVGGDRAEVRLLMPPGVESHSYEPTPADMLAINACDLFIYTGEHMEPWAENILRSTTNENLIILDLSAGVALSGAHTHDGETTADPHIWTSPVIAKQMVTAIQNALAYKDPDGADTYKRNAEAYVAELDALDAQFRDIVASGARKKMIFGGRFAFHYFVEEYGLEYDAAFDACGEETEPSAASLARIIGEVRDEGIPVVYYEELTEPKVARSIARETGAEPLLFHSCHNVSRDEFEQGVTYLDLMRQNAENLKRGLQ